MSIEDEIISEGIKIPTPNVDREEIPTASKGIAIDFSILKTQTGDGEVSEYINHVLNFNNSQGMARIIRGLTGFAGNMNYAFIDIIVGFLDLTKKKVKIIEPANNI